MQQQQATRNRMRWTPALARKEDTEKVIAAWEWAIETMRAARDGKLIDGKLVGPATLARAKKVASICRPELLRRSFDPEDIDYEAGAELDNEQPQAAARDYEAGTAF